MDLLSHVLNLFFGQGDLESVVTSSDRLEIPLFLLDSDGTHSVFDDRKECQSGKDIDARCDQGLMTFLLKFLFADETVVLDEERVSLGDVAGTVAGLRSERDLIMDAVDEA